MTREKFIKELKDLGYHYEIQGDMIVVTHEGSVYLGSLISLPSGVVFKNSGDLYLNYLTFLPPGVEFENEGSISLNSLTSLPPDAVFRNGIGVKLYSLNSIPPGVEFSKGINIYLTSLTGGRFYDWKGNIEGIGSSRLLNKMISIGLFDKKR
jgi:hypothetical protein